MLTRAWFSDRSDGRRLRRPAHIEPNNWNSSSASRSVEAARFSSRRATEEVPGIGSMTGERRSSQARATWAAVAWWRRATLEEEAARQPAEGRLAPDVVLVGAD